MIWWGLDDHTYQAILFIASSSSSSSSRGTTYSRITPFYFQSYQVTLYLRLVKAYRLFLHAQHKQIFALLTSSWPSVYSTSTRTCSPEFFCLWTLMTVPVNHVLYPRHLAITWSPLAIGFCKTLWRARSESNRVLSLISWCVCSLTARAGTSRCNQTCCVNCTYLLWLILPLLTRIFSLSSLCKNEHHWERVRTSVRKSKEKSEHQWERVRKKQMESRFVPPRAF